MSFQDSIFGQTHEIVNTYRAKENLLGNYSTEYHKCKNESHRSNDRGEFLAIDMSDDDLDSSNKYRSQYILEIKKIISNLQLYATALHKKDKKLKLSFEEEEILKKYENPND
ncbi:MAG: hypothetical protein SFU98_05015 [Leptospiraceae bacterium]|nr:hypothetical protein [Leptospiraceae bacterium]